MHNLQPQNIKRKEFVRMAAIGGLGLYLVGCNSTTPKAKSAVANAPDTTQQQKATPQVKQAGNDDVIFYRKNEARYDELRQGFNKRINKYPDVIALCKTNDGVAEALYQAQKHSLPVAVKSGGHCTEGFSVNEGGMVINMSSFNTVELLNDGMVKTGPGVKLAQMYDTLFPQKKLVPAGACGTVGIGGLALGGGYGFFSRQHGLCCDHLTQVTMLDAKGQMHIAKEGDELLWACRGGGNGNFGIITEMVFRSHDAPPTFQSFRFTAYNVDLARVTSIMEGWFAIAANLPKSCFSAIVLNGKTVYILLTTFEKPNQELQEAIDAISNLTDKPHLGPAIETAKALKFYYGADHPVYFKNSSAGLYGGYAEIEKFIPQVIETVMNTPGMMYQINTLGGNIDNPDFEKAAAYPHRAKHFVSELQTYWEQPAHEARLGKAFAQVQDVFMDNGILAQYCNYPYLGFKDWQHAYYGNNYARLQTIKAQYDPNNLIRSEQSVTMG